MPSSAAESANHSTENPDGDGSGATEEEKKDDRMFECNICLDTARDAVLAMSSSVVGNEAKPPSLSSLQSGNKQRKKAVLSKKTRGRRCHLDRQVNAQNLNPGRPFQDLVLGEIMGFICRSV
ncbi:E3 ubiquitin-protein ligase RNF185 [Asbolus verrucosus]|uniref:E3 ubiquitin-protein ligase RNF185 n=1 Tax=Asbolus verrucosus TaxID=1661398 RepID=A0A482V6G3_ASBVE|nr:E3 ubiquitin-protein ligase RNF185 [Asbolus verrucosus]